MLDRNKVIESWGQVCKAVQVEGLPAEIIRQALQANPWLTPYYIERAISGLLTWDEQALHAFVATYPQADRPAKWVGIIAAGNVPFVGMHDVLMALLAGHRVRLKCSHQDIILMKWWIEKWRAALGSAQDYLRIVSQIGQTDYLIATGSNNTARYIQANYPQPKLIRKNRFSVALLKPGLSAHDLGLLAEDILLYNGLGCRNVSNIWVMPKANFDLFVEKLDEYPSNQLNSHYLERLLFLQAEVSSLGLGGKATKYIFCKPTTVPKPAPMGILHIQHLAGEHDIAALTQHYQSHIQCIVGTQVAYGHSQQPSLGDFADGIDTYQLLLEL